MLPERQGLKPARTGWQWVGLGASILAFGVLMGVRTDIASEWGRAAIAAVAFVVLFSGIGFSRQR
jgi:hypothetical protein